MARIERPHVQRNFPLLLFLVALLLLALRALYPEPAEGWRTARAENLEGAQTEAKSKPASAATTDRIRWVSAASSELGTGKPIFYYFTAAWCGPCRQLSEEVFSDPEMASWIEERLVPVRVDEEELASGEPADLAFRFGIQAYPTLVVTDAAGRMLGMQRGYASKGGQGKHEVKLFLTRALKNLPAGVSAN